MFKPDSFLFCFFQNRQKAAITKLAVFIFFQDGNIAHLHKCVLKSALYFVYYICVCPLLCKLVILSLL